MAMLVYQRVQKTFQKCCFLLLGCHIRATRWWQLKDLFIFTPKIGEIIQFDMRRFFKWVGSTTN